MLTKRIIPCLDVDMGKVVKGINFVDLQDVGDPVKIAQHYDKQGADEIVFLDITATHEKRKTIVNLVEKTAEKVFIPLTVGGGISSLDDFKNILRAGADKISVNSSAVKNPGLIYEAADKFGSQCVVVAVDAKKRKNKKGWDVFVEGGRENTGMDAVEWIKKAESLGAGEVLLTSMDADGTEGGYDIELTRAVCSAVNIPVIASGGCGSLKDFYRVFNETGADAALAASLFHYGELTVCDVKQYLKDRDVPVRM
ncbi:MULTISPECIES: imidazole glycerol phosphate synthase subunit HisF [Clostridium]|uniref:Imidazole glycerol phosphate synthase subunit HisF n=1 Tax=Clostridium lapidicellarium TaxID=3240931 RepID=A0ABV4DVL5_9CLOT